MASSFGNRSIRWFSAGLLALAACSAEPPSAPIAETPDTPAPAEPAAEPEPDPEPEPEPEPVTDVDRDRSCQLVPEGFGPTGQVSVRAEEVVSGLDVPWGILFLSETEMLVTERSGQIRLVQNGQLQPDPVATVPAVDRGEGGLLDIVAHPDFDQNRQFYLYYTSTNGDNRVERWQLAADSLSASPDQVIVDGIPVAQFHNGGRLRFGPDDQLYIGTGDARDPNLSQDPNSLAGKILRVTADGDIPADNPFPDSPTYLLGIRNTQGFDWFDDTTLWVTDHGPSGELGRQGHDKVSVANPGDNLGWPTLHACDTQGDLVPASLTWRQAVPPGGAAIYTGSAIPEWQGDLILGALGSRHLQRIVFNPDTPYQVEHHEVYFQDELGRIREVVMGPDNHLYITTSNCDGRGQCPSGGDRIYRITSGG
jgi:glucose/arabinose dehydrogenase